MEALEINTWVPVLIEEGCTDRGDIVQEGAVVAYVSLSLPQNEIEVAGRIETESAIVAWIFGKGDEDTKGGQEGTVYEHRYPRVPSVSNASSPSLGAQA